MRFKLNTAYRDTGRVKGWNVTSDMEQTLAEVIKRKDAAEIEAFVAAVKTEIGKAEVKLKQAEEDIRSPRAVRGTRFGAKIGQRYDRASNKIDRLKNALIKLSTETGYDYRSPD